MMTNPFSEFKRAVSWHKERHRPSGFSFAIADSIDFIDSAAWDSITEGGSFFLKRAYLRALESSAPENMKARCGLIFDGKKPAAAVAMQLVAISADRVMSREKASGEALSKVTANALICGNLFTWGQHGVAFAANADPTEVWRGVAEVLYRVRRAEKLSGKTDLVMVKDLNSGSAGVAALARYSYNPVSTEPDMVLELDPAWKHFNDYLTCLHSRYRKNALRITKDLEKAGCIIEPMKDWSRNAQDIYALYLAVHSAASVRPVTATPGYLTAVAEAAGEGMRCTCIRKNGELLGFVTTIRENEKTAVGYHLGFDRSKKSELPLYFALLQAVIGDAISLGCQRVSLGRTALEPKAKLGACPVPTEIWVRHANPLANVIVKRLLSMVHHDEAPDRNPFKESGNGLENKEN